MFVEKLGKQVVEKVSNTEITEQERYNNFKTLYLSSLTTIISQDLSLEDTGKQ